MRGKVLLPNVVRVIAICIFILGAFIGWDFGNKSIIIGNEVKYTFDFITSFLWWFGAFAIGMMFVSIARIIDLLEEMKSKEKITTYLKK
ncbi:hypothetical protein H9X78_01285 [Clostridium saudiense]|nr:hypothetical protein [Clostridium saudiense]